MSTRVLQFRRKRAFCQMRQWLPESLVDGLQPKNETREHIKVWAVKVKGRKYKCRWRNPETGLFKQCTSGTYDRDEARKVAARVERELNAE